LQAEFINQPRGHVRSAGAQQQHHAGSRPVGYGLFGCTVEQVRQRVQPDVIAEHAGFFKVAGIFQRSFSKRDAARTMSPPATLAQIW